MTKDVMAPMTISKHSTFEEAWEYMQSFRPTDEEMSGWLDGTHAYRYPPFPNEEWSTTIFFWHDDTSGEYPKGLQEYQVPTLAQFTDERSGRVIAHRGDGKPAVVSFLDKLHFGMEAWVAAQYIENGKYRRGNQPWRIELTMTREVSAVLFCGSDAKDDSHGRHRLDGPHMVRRKSWDVIEITYAISGETVEKVEVRRGAGTT